MKLFYYIHNIDRSSNLAFTTSAEPIEKIGNTWIELSEKDLEKYRLYIKYINCCTLGSDGELKCDYIQVLSEKLAELDSNIKNKTRELRLLLLEASAMNNKSVVAEIAEVIKSLNEFIKGDFSGITDIDQIENITCAELHINYTRYYESEIYGI